MVVASPNGAGVSLTAAESGATVLAGSLRNATAIAQAALAWGTPIGVVASGEQWGASGMLRPSFEDLVGAGAIITALGSEGVSPEALAAEAAYRAVSHDLAKMLAQCGSGRELIEKGFQARHNLGRETRHQPHRPDSSLWRLREFRAQGTTPCSPRSAVAGITMVCCGH